MKNAFYLSTCLGLLTASADPIDLPKIGTNLPPCCVVKKAEAAPISDQSLFLLDSNWTTDFAREIKLKELRGKPQVVTMFFASCIYACPILVHDMKKVEAALPEELRKKVNFTMVSFDSERDTAKVLSQFRTTHSLPSNWTLLRGSPDDVLELSALLGVKFKKERNGQYAHSNILTVLNAEGEIVFQKAGLNSDPSETVAALQKALEKQIHVADTSTKVN